MYQVSSLQPTGIESLSDSAEDVRFVRGRGNSPWITSSLLAKAERPGQITSKGSAVVVIQEKAQGDRKFQHIHTNVRYTASLKSRCRSPRTATTGRVFTKAVRPLPSRPTLLRNRKIGPSKQSSCM